MTIPVLEIQQTKGLQALVKFDDGKWEVEFHDPFTPAQEEELRWYFESHLDFPMLDGDRADKAAASVRAYGESVFGQLFQNTKLFAAFDRHRSEGVRIQIEGDPEFHRLHWETLWEPEEPQPLAYRTVITRRVTSQGKAKIDLAAGATIRVLVVVARPHGAGDVGYRTISRPLVETLHQAELAVELNFVRPGTWTQLQKHLGDTPRGYYHALHFDGHGAVAQESLTSKKRNASLYFEGDKEGVGKRVPASDVADLVNEARIPVVILNACQSGKQESEPETNLASRLAQAGVRTVLGMGYSVTVSAARHFMEAFYRAAFNGVALSEAVTRARGELRREKRRRASFGLKVELEDWMLPVLYEGEAVRLQVRATGDEEREVLRRRAGLFAARPMKHRFWGRDLDVLGIERRVLRDGKQNILLVEGMGGTGKTTLLQHLGWWWQVTGLVGRVFVFEYDQKSWTRQQILFEIARVLDMRIDPDERVAQEAVAARLRSERCLLMLDNLESVTGEQLAIGHAMAEGERHGLQELLGKLRGGRTLVLVGSRSKEGWLAPGTFEANVYELGGLDREAGSSFADEVLRGAKADVEVVRTAPEYRELLQLLGGHPLAMQVILSNLGAKSPAEVLKALREGDVGLDRGETRTESILKCIDYSHSNLTAEARELLQCLAPFSGVVFLGALDKYVALLKKQPELAGVKWEGLSKVLAEAEKWGLVRVEGPLMYLQPVFPYFLRSRGEAARKAAVEVAFREHYQGLCGEICDLQTSKEPKKRQVGQWLAKLEYENGMRALELSLEARVSIWEPIRMLSQALDDARDHVAGLALAERVSAAVEWYPEEILAGPLGFEMVGVVDDVARRFLLLKRFPQAKDAYGRALSILTSNASVPAERKGKVSAGIWHQLGMVAEEQRDWAAAEKSYREALRICIEPNYRYEQAATFHQLGRVAQEQRDWEEAEKNYRQALRIKVEFNDRHSQGNTYLHLGKLAQEQRDWENAEKNYHDALRIFIEFSDRYSQAHIYGQRGVLAHARGRWEEAEKNYRETLRIFVEFNDRHSQGTVYNQLGSVAGEQGQWAEAEKYFLEALRIYLAFDSQHDVARTLHNLGLMAAERPGLSGRVGEILGETAEEVQQRWSSPPSEESAGDETS